MCTTSISQKKHQIIDWIKLDKILILDFGSQYTQLIARRIREMNVFCEIHPYDVSLEKINDFSPKAIILSGGPNSVYEDETPKAPQEIFKMNIPILGICYGMQTLCEQLGGKVTLTVPSVSLVMLKSELMATHFF